MYAGIEGGGTKFVVGVGTGPADLRRAESIPTTSPDETLGQAVEAIADLASPGLAAIGIGSFGPVDLDPGSRSYGYVTSTPKAGWARTDVVGRLEDAFDVPVAFDTDVNAAALGEARWGATRGLDSSVYVTVGTGIGGGAVVDGHPLHGLMHPEMGHLPVRRHPDDDYRGGCPYHTDCLEGLASGPAIEARWGRRGEELTDTHEQAIALEAWYLAQLAASITYVLSPQRIVFGGGVMGLAGLLDAIRTTTVDIVAGYVARSELTTDIDRYLVRAGLGDNAGVLGAIALARDAADEPRD